MSIYKFGGMVQFFFDLSLHQGVYGGCTVVKRSSFLCWNGALGRTQTACTQKYTDACSAIFLQGNSHKYTCSFAMRL